MIYVILYIFLETIITIEVGSILGGGFTFLEFIVTFLVGLFILKNFQYGIMDTLMSLYQKEITSKDMISITVLSLVGAILLMIPGIFSDILGLLLQLEFFAIFVAEQVIKRAKNVSVNSNFRTTDNFRNNNINKSEIIDVEVMEEKYIEKTKNKGNNYE
jgi:2-isopropylmalate synthase/UPF0716 protein FxsA